MKQISTPQNPLGSVLVVGGGIAGMQSALDLAGAGFFVYLLDRSPSIGGIMARLDKTFPTNDCSTCMISPRLVEVAGHPAIQVITLAELIDLNGQPGRFTARILKHPRYVDEEKCVGCGVCAEKCPKKVSDPFNENLGQRKAIFLDYPQAIPLVFTIDRENCIYFQKGKCRACEKFCENKAIDFNQEPKEINLEVGAVLLSPGFTPFNAERKPELGFGRYEDVVTSIQFERILAAAGPFGGHVKRLSDGKEPQKIAWIQCVGSRDACLGNDYCSSVCCMVATKQAIIAKEHFPDIAPTIFFIDIRAQGKGFDQYYERAKSEHGVRYVRSMISRVIEQPLTKQLEVQYFDEADRLQVEVFDLVVLSVGLEPHQEGISLARKLGLDLDAFGFAARKEINPLITNRPGIYVAGVFNGPKDIPESVTQASAAAGQVGELLAPARGSLIPEKTFPEARQVTSEKPRIGVIVCHCGINIAGVVDVADVSAYARSLPDVVWAEDILFACSTDSQDRMRQAIVEQGLNRVIVASCSPRTHEPLFQENLRQAGLNKYLFEMANIRDHCSWVHADDHQAATQKAKDLVRMSISRARLLEPLEQVSAPVHQSGLVIGGGVAGMTAALSLAEQDFPVNLVERGPELGGLARRLIQTTEGFEVRDYLKDLISKIEAHPKIRIFTNTEVQQIDGVVGWFTTDLKGSDGAVTRVDHGAVIVATGGTEYRPSEYGFGSTTDILTQMEFQETLGKGTAEDFRKVVMIQCVGSREAEHPYCSRLCCSQAIGNALKLKALNPGAEVIILYRDIRTYGLKEVYYKQAREAGVRFVRFDPEEPPSVAIKDGQLTVTVLDQSLRERLSIQADKIVLSAAVRPDPEAKALGSLLKLPLDRDGFFMEAHLKLRPLDFSSSGYFLCGLAHGPKPIDETVVQAKGAAARAATILGRKFLQVGGEVAVVDRRKCSVCLSCVRACPFGVPRVINGAAQMDPAACRGCGVCAGVCPGKAIQVAHHQDNQIMAKAEALFNEPSPGDDYTPQILAFICTYCTYTAADMAGSMRLQYPPDVRVVKLLCTGRIDVKHLMGAFEAGADAVMVSGCELGDCHFREGNYRAVKRVAQTKQILADCGLEPERIEMFHVGASDAPGWAEAVKEMVGRAKRLGPSPLRSEKKIAA